MIQQTKDKFMKLFKDASRDVVKAARSYAARDARTNPCSGTGDLSLGLASSPHHYQTASIPKDRRQDEYRALTAKIMPWAQ